MQRNLVLPTMTRDDRAFLLRANVTWDCNVDGVDIAENAYLRDRIGELLLERRRMTRCIWATGFVGFGLGLMVSLVACLISLA